MSIQDAVALFDAVGVHWAAVGLTALGLMYGLLKLRDVTRMLREHLTVCHDRQARALARVEAELRDSTAKGREGRAALHGRMDEIGKAVARIEGRMER